MKSRASKSLPRSQSRAEKNPREKTEKTPPQDAAFPIVAIGASAGGLEAFTEFFHALPPDTGMAFVLVQHLDPTHHSMLAEILGKATKMPVEEVKSGVKVRRNRVYVIPPNACLAIAADVFKLTPRLKGPTPQLAVNFFMRSLAEDRKSTAIAIVLSGTGVDGTTGMENIKAEGGITFAQEPSTARYDGMPRSAIDSGCVDFVLRPKDIARELARIQHHPYILGQEKAKAERGQELVESGAPMPRAEKDFTSILEQLRKTSGVDFSQYKPNTIHRRALRRMVILKQDSLGAYAKHLKEHPDEAGKLFDDVLIPVTSFFRDFEAFEALKAQVYPAIVKDKGNKGTIRMWAPGCSTGEETYSLAMTLLEFLGDKAASFQVQIFGTDLNEKGIQHARAGLYRESIAEEISPERMARFFIKVDEGYRVNKAVRDMCVFARQNLANDPPFSQMNLVACRNLLIYIQPSLQKKIVPILHYALKASGFLVLGGSESVSAFPDLFSTVDKKHKIYCKKSVASRLHYDFVQSYYPAYPAGSRLDVSGKGLKSAPPASDEIDVQAEADRLVLKHHAPVGVVVNSAMEVVQFRGRTTPYLEQSAGKPSLNILKLAHNSLAVELRTLIGAAAKSGAPANKYGVRFDGNGHPRTLDLSVLPLGENGKKEKGAREKRPVDNRFFLVLFDDVTSQWMPDPKDGLPDKGKGNGKTTAPTLRAQREMQWLQQQASSAQQALQATIESEDALKEEFQSANEEILSANEELQSTNEELETSKEELQSANEELNTLNAELRNKNSELHDLSNDISNFLNSTRIPVVMLDRHLHIRRFTPAANKLLKVVASDIGRPFADIRSNIEASSLEPVIAQVLESLQPWTGEVKDFEGHWHELSVLPYRTQDNKIDGVVLALQDIDAIKAAGEQLRQSAEFFRNIIDTVREPLLVLDAELRVVAANVSFLESFQVSQEKTVGTLLYDLGNGQWDIPLLRTLLEQVLAKKQAVTDFEVERDFESIGQKTMVLNARTMAQMHDDAQPMLLLAIEDVTEIRRAEEKSLELQQRLMRERRVHDTTLSSITDFAYTVDREGRFLYANQPLLDFWGLKLEELVGKNLFEVQEQEELNQRLQQQIRQVFATGQRLTDESPYTSPAGVVGYYEYTFNPVFGADGTVELLVGSTHDLTERRRAEATVRESEELFRALFTAAPMAVYVCDRNATIQNYNRRAAEIWGREPVCGVDKYCGSARLWQTDGSLLPPEQNPIVEVLRTGVSAFNVEVLCERQDGARVPVLVNFAALRDAEGEIAGAIATFVDITERKLTEAALIKSEKLAAAGRLAATLAHEINNPLQAVTNLLSLLGQSPRLDTQEQEYARMAREELERVTHLTQQSLGFYRESIHPTAVNLEEVVESLLTLYAKRLAAKKITVRKQYESNGATIVSYPGEIRQVLSTLLMNAMEAVPEGGRFALRVSESTDWTKRPPSEGLRVTLADSGCGIPAHHAERIFEPFFTTKGEKGTGLGLWLARGIAQRMGGSIHMRSRVHPEKSGTCFSVFLPNGKAK